MKLRRIIALVLAVLVAAAPALATVLTPIQTNFTAGELSPRLDGRVDVVKYANGCKRLENMRVHPHGGADRRPGLRYVADVKTHTRKVRLIPFVFSEGQAYILEFGNAYIRFYYQGGQLMDGASPYEIASPYLEGQLDEIHFTQSADVMYLAHPTEPPKILTRTGHTSWAIASVSFTSKPSEWTMGNYPSAVGFYEQRLWWAGTVNQPQTLWASVAGSYHDMTTGTEDDDALKYTIASDRVNRIVWILPSRKLLVGTMGSEWTAGASSTLQPMTPLNAVFNRQTTYGSSSKSSALLVDNLAFFVGQHGRKLREFSYVYASDGYKGLDLTLLAEHITRPSIGQFGYQADPDSTFWVVRSDGVLLGCTYYAAEDVIAWHRHITQGEFESVAVIPYEGADQVWCLVKRTIGGATKRFVEVLEPWNGDDIKDAFFVDCGLTYEGAATATINGLDHLEGQTVQILTDGAPHPDRVVTSGAITLQWPTSKAHVGLGYTSLLETMRLEVGTQSGTVQGRFKRIGNVTLRLYQTVGGEVGPSEDKLTRMHYRTAQDNMDEAIPPFTGDKQATLGGGYSRDGRVVVRQNQPLPMTVLAIIPEMELSE